MIKDKKPVIAYLHTHFDPEWYRTKASFNIRLVEIFDIVLDELKKGKMPSFYFDGQVYSLLNYLKFRPNKKNLVKKFIKEKKLFIGPFFALIDSFLAGGALLIENLSLGLKFSKNFQEKFFIGYLADTFGHSKGIFEILKFFDIENAVIWRGAEDSLPSDFIFSNTKITRLVFGYYQDILHSNLPIQKKAEILENILNKIDSKSKNILLLPIGGDHLAPVLDSINEVDSINKYLKNYKIKLSDLFEYVKKAEFTKTERDEKEFLNNSSTYLLKGVYSNRISSKIESAFVQFELFYKAKVMNYFLSGKYNKELEEVTLELIKNHAHDSIYGCSIDEVQKNVECRYINIKESLKTLFFNMKRDFIKENRIKDTVNKLLVFNFSNFPQKGVVKVVADKKIKHLDMKRKFYFVSDEILSDIKRNPMTEDFREFYEYLVEIDEIKPFSYKTFEIKKPVKRHLVQNDCIENEFLKLFVLDNKIYVIDKKSGKIYNDFIEIHSTKDDGDSYNFAPSENYKVLKLKGSKINKKGNTVSSLKLIFEENIVLNVYLTNSSEFLEFEGNFINKKKNRKLQIVFNSSHEITKTIAEDAIGTIERKHDPDYLLYLNMPTKNREELKTNSYPMQRFVSANDVNIITMGLNEYEVYKNQIKITFLRSTGVISNPLNKARKVPAGPPIECPMMQELGKKQFKLGVCFNQKNLFMLADNFYNPFYSIFGEFKKEKNTYIKTDDKSLFYGIIEKDKKLRPLFYKNQKFEIR